MKKAMKNLIILGAIAMFAMTMNVTNAQFDNGAVVNATDAILNASINPNGTATSAWFEYGTDVNMYSVNETPHIYMGSGYGESPLSQKVTNLNPNTVYFYRAVANNGTMIKGNIMSFSTTSVGATTQVYTNTNTNTYSNNNSYVNTASTNYSNYNANDGVNITNITATGAILNAVLTNPNHNSAQGYFEWGPTTSFGNSTMMNNLGTGYTSNFSGTLSGLTPNTTYYFRAVAVLNGKVIKGGTRNFQTYGTTNVQMNNFQAPSVTTNQGQVLGNQFMNTNTGVVTQNNTLAANSLFGANFLPTNIFGWLILLLVILAIVWALRKLSQPTTYVVQRPNH